MKRLRMVLCDQVQVSLTTAEEPAAACSKTLLGEARWSGAGRESAAAE
jgi:hypothetical protein